MDTISLETAIAITGISRSTLWRRVTDGRISKAANDRDSRNRAMLDLADVLPLVAGVKLDAEDIEVLLKADAGSAEAQADMGALFHTAGLTKAALYWLEAAAEQDHADAMHWLAIIHAAQTPAPSPASAPSHHADFALSGGGGAKLYRNASAMTISPSCGWPGPRRWGTRLRSSRWSG